MNSFENIKNTIAIFGVPRSGTSWLGQIFNSSPNVAFRFQPLFSYELKNRLNENSSQRDINFFYQDLINTKSDFVLQKNNVSGQESPVFMKKKITTLVWKEVRYINIIENLLENSETKLILLTRHPAGVINSWLKAPKEFKESWDPIKEWRYAQKKNAGKPEEYNGYEKWKEAMNLFMNVKNKYSERVKIIKYEDLVKNPHKETKTLFDFAQISFDIQTKKFLEDSTAYNDKDSYGVFREKQDINKWKQQLDPQIKDEIIADLAHFSPTKNLGYS